MTMRVNNAANCTYRQNDLDGQEAGVKEFLKAEGSNKGHVQLFMCTLFAYIVQFVMSSESMLPSKPKRAPDAPTEILD